MDSTSSRELQIAEKIAPFIEKLASLVEDTNHDDLIRWSDDGMSFIVVDKKEFVDKLLPEMFKHQNFPSFVRQLNMYGFQKVPPMPVTVDRAGERRAPMDMTEYRHPYFIRDRPRLLFRIKRNQSRRELAAAAPPPPGRDGIITAGVHPMQMGGPSRQDNNNQLASSGFHAQGLNMQTRDAQSLRDNLREAREQQGVITRAINGLHGANRGLSDQNLVFQRLHDQHEHSINAILDYMVLLLPRSFNDYINGPEGSSGMTLGQDAAALSVQQGRDHHRAAGSPGHVLDSHRRDYLTQHGSNNGDIVWDPVQASDAPGRSTMTGAPPPPPHERTADASQAGLYGLTGRRHDVQTASSSHGCKTTLGEEATLLHGQPHHHRSLGFEQLRAMQEDQDTRISNIRTMVHTLSPRIGGGGNIHAPGLVDDTGSCVPCRGEARCQTHSGRDDAKCENTAPPDDEKLEQKGDVDYFSWPSSQYR